MDATTTFQKYPAYKHSGVDWLGEIPVGWEVKRLRLLGSFTKGGGFAKSDLTDSGFSAILYGDIYTKYEFKISNPVRCISTKTAKKSTKIKKGDLLFTGSGETKEDIGKCVVLDFDDDTYAGGDIIIFRQPFHDSIFLSYYLNAEIVKSEKAKTAKGEIIVHTYATKLGEINICLPPLPEQAAIAAFLDDKTAKIDRAIAQKEKMIALLKERKQIIIQQAVTKGLDPNAKMKDSGVEWIGEVPEGWEVKRLKFLIKRAFSGGTPATDKLEYWDGGIPWVSSVDVKNDFLSNTHREISEKGLFQSSSNLAPKGSIVFVTRSGILQHTFALSILNKEMAINQDIKCLILSSQISELYFLRLIQGNNSKILAETRQQAATVESINMNSFFNLPIPIPPINEQTAIVHHIETQSAKTDRAIALQEQQIAKLKELKATLIDGAVTGKIKVI